MTEITKLLDRWATDEGKPYKGSLIDWQAYEADTGLELAERGEE